MKRGRDSIFITDLTYDGCSMQSLSFKKCTNIPSEYADTANRLLWHIPELILPAPLYRQKASLDSG